MLAGITIRAGMLAFSVMVVRNEHPALNAGNRFKGHDLPSFASMVIAAQRQACMTLRVDFPKTQGVKIRRAAGLTTGE